MTTMTDQLTPKDQLEYYQSLLDNLLGEENTDIKDYYISKYKEKIEDLMFHILKNGDSWD